MERPLIARLFQPVDTASLVVFRICFGLIMVWEAGRYLYSNWVGPFWIVPGFHFKYFGFGWAHPWDGGGMYLHFLGLAVLGLCIAAGLWYRLVMSLFFLAFTYVFLLDKSYYLNHFYLVVIISFLLNFVPAHRAFSVDAWWNPKIRSRTTPIWTVWALALQIVIPYFHGGIAKLKADWLILGEPMRIFLLDAAKATSLPEVLTAEPAVYLFAWGGALFDLLIPFLLWWPRTRAVAFVAAVGFHLTNAFLFNIGIFPWFMICATTLFLSPNWPRRFGFPPAPAGKRVSLGVDASVSPSWTQKAVVSLLSLHFVIQLLVPFRHYLYPGDVHWTGEGSHFAWHMRLNAMNGAGVLIATAPSTGESWKVDPSRHLSPRQTSVLSLKSA